MKTKLVLWGNDENDERVLIAMQLRPEANLVDIWTFPEAIATEEFAQNMMNEWRLDKDFELPEEKTHIERELTVSENLLPDNLKVTNTDLVQRAQTEWHFIVLSSKLHQNYKAELEELSDRIERLEQFDRNVWDNLKDFWSKVQDQVRDRNLFREHSNTLRDQTNGLFAKLKDMRNRMDEEFSQKSKGAKEKLMSNLEEIEGKIKEGGHLQHLFDDLKKLQKRFKDSKLTRDDRTKVWDRLDKAFKQVKEKRFGPGASQDSTPLQRIKRRYDGLMNAIEKMERSIKRDNDDLSFQRRKIESTDGQLEAQIREAKIKMIEERIRSKSDKLDEMNTTKTDLEKRMAGLQEKEEKRKEKEQAEAEKVAAQEAAKQKIAAEIKEKTEALEDDREKLEKAATALAGEDAAETEAETEAPSVMETIQDTVEDMVDTVKAVAGIVSEKIGEKFEELTEQKKKDTPPPADEEE
ncbi:MAG: hypothetical protein KDC44_23980 [Phaeodactylibacter sp.]|nr:hypothetical protein [Phaeodactylibacter sp.]